MFDPLDEQNLNMLKKYEKYVKYEKNMISFYSAS